MIVQQSASTLDLPAPSEIAWQEAQIRSRLNGMVRDFQLRVRDDGLILQGFAHSYYAKQLAQHAVMQVTDFPILANEIEVG